MCNQRFALTSARRSYLKIRWVIISGIVLASSASTALGDNLSVVHDLARRVGPIIGSALACQNIARPRVQVIVDKFEAVIREAATNDAERAEVSRLFDRSVADGRGAVTTGQLDCRAADRQLDDLEQVIAHASVPPPRASSGPSLADAMAPSAANAAVAPTQPPSAANAHGVTDREIRFGIVIPYSGAAKENGHNVKLGLDVAFDRVNDAGGVNGRLLKLIAADDGFEPTRTLDAMKSLWEQGQVFGYIGNHGTPTAAVALPFALERRVLFFAPLTGANVVRHDPPDRYVFNYRPSYSEETDAAVRYLVKIRKLQPKQIAVFAENDSFGDAGFAGVAKAFRALGFSDSPLLRLNYTRNTLDVDDAVSQLRLQKVSIRAVVMVATTRPAAKFIEKTRDLFRGIIYTNMSSVGASSLADELMLLGPRFTDGVIVTQTVPSVSGYSTIVMEYKTALAKYFPGENPDYISLEGFISANVLIDALRRCGPQVDTERLVDMLENTSNLDLGLGIPLGFSRGEHQASHKIWGTALDETGKYRPIELE
ncbi:ABC transporter substrate-binding protein [Bradyrhizobium sp.]|uniref:ABC transporter substrate-binding protein n=1 Tax=Bradyrhizobium sp. TaxID=376 RepID=UPI003C52CADC